LTRKAQAEEGRTASERGGEVEGQVWRTSGNICGRADAVVITLSAGTQMSAPDRSNSNEGSSSTFVEYYSDDVDLLPWNAAGSVVDIAK
jgi:hypothetical protein